MAVSTVPELSDLIGKAIQDAVRNEVTRIVEDSIEEAKQNLEDELPKIVSTVTLKVYDRIRIKHFGKELCIYIRLDKNGENTL